MTSMPPASSHPTGRASARRSDGSILSATPIRLIASVSLAASSKIRCSSLHSARSSQPSPTGPTMTPIVRARMGSETGPRLSASDANPSASTAAPITASATFMECMLPASLSRNADRRHAFHAMPAPTTV